MPKQDDSPGRLIDGRIAELGDWRGEMLATVRALIMQADPDVVEEWKWSRAPRRTRGRGATGSRAPRQAWDLARRLTEHRGRIVIGSRETPFRSG